MPDSAMRFEVLLPLETRRQVQNLLLNLSFSDDFVLFRHVQVFSILRLFRDMTLYLGTCTSDVHVLRFWKIENFDTKSSR